LLVNLSKRIRNPLAGRPAAATHSKVTSGRSFSRPIDEAQHSTGVAFTAVRVEPLGVVNGAQATTIGSKDTNFAQPGAGQAEQIRLKATSVVSRE
jgi:hypothetical protein